MPATTTDLAVEIAALATFEEIVRRDDDTWLTDHIDRIVSEVVPAEELESVRESGRQRGLDLADELWRE